LLQELSHKTGKEQIRNVRELLVKVTSTLAASVIYSLSGSVESVEMKLYISCILCRVFIPVSEGAKLKINHTRVIVEKVAHFCGPLCIYATINVAPEQKAVCSTRDVVKRLISVLLNKPAKHIK